MGMFKRELGLEDKVEDGDNSLKVNGNFLN